MSCNINNKFYGIESIGEVPIMVQIEDNLKSFLDYGLLNIGAFVNVSVPTSGLYSNTFSSLRPATEPTGVGAKTVKIWQTPKKDWIWESGISFNGSYPTPITGVIVNGTGFPVPTGNSNLSFKLDYTDGQVLFNKGLSATTDVKMAYSYRWCQVVKSSNNDLWKQLQLLTYKPDAQININNKGDYNLSSNHRIQLPAIVIEPGINNTDIPYELGSLVSFRNQDFLMHIYAENNNDAYKIIDIIKLQKDNNICMYNIKQVVSSGIYGLNADGSKNINGLNYGQIINNSNLRWKNLYIKSVNIVDMQKNNVSNIVWCMLRVTCEVIL